MKEFSLGQGRSPTAVCPLLPRSPARETSLAFPAPLPPRTQNLRETSQALREKVSLPDAGMGEKKSFLCPQWA